MKREAMKEKRDNIKNIIRLKDKLAIANKQLKEKSDKLRSLPKEIKAETKAKLEEYHNRVLKTNVKKIKTIKKINNNLKNENKNYCCRANKYNKQEENIWQHSIGIFLLC